MTMLIHCPSCQTALHVPQGSSGRPARCPSCKTKFEIPHPKQIMEETVAAWLVSDFLAKEDQEEREEDDALLKELAKLDDIQLDDLDDDAQEVSQSEPKTQSAHATTSVASPAAPATPPPAKSPPVVERPVVVHVPATAVPPPSPTGVNKPTEPAAPTATAPLPSFYSAASGARGSWTTVSEPPTALGAGDAVSGKQPEAAAGAPPAEPAAARPTSKAADSAATPAAVVSASPAAVPSAPSLSPKPARASDPAASIFPTELIITGPRPHLAVLEINQSGVKFAFDSIWLEQMAFRCSMPVRGVFGGNKLREDLRARPMVWADRSGAVIRSVAEVEARYEQPFLPNWNHRDVINAMGIIEGLPRPFCNPMPYFVDKYHLNLSLSCSTFKRPDGGLTCEVIIVNGEVALEWLRNVNGICGPEYEALERELQILHSDRWAMLPEQVRQRVSVWCRFQTRERFQLYLNDAEMAQRDAGLAGIVITDRRLIYHKFHHNGQVDLASPGTLLMKKMEDCIQLYYEGWNMPGHRVKLIKLKHDDGPTLLTALAAHPTLQVQQSG